MRQTQNTQKNSNKKSVFVIALLLLLVAVIGFGGYTMSKYISSKKDGANASVAKWGFTVSADASKLFGKNYEKTSTSSTVSEKTNAAELTVQASVADSKVVAPGTTGSMTFSIAGTAEVKSQIAVSLTGKDVVLKYTATGVANGEYAPVKWTLKKKNGDTATVLVDNKSFDELQVGLADLNATLDPNASYEKAGEYTIEWAWAFETGSDDNEKALNNKLDTFLGAIANKIDTTKDATNTYTKAEGTSTTINFNLSISVTQLQQ